MPLVQPMQKKGWAKSSNLSGLGTEKHRILYAELSKFIGGTTIFPCERDFCVFRNHRFNPYLSGCTRKYAARWASNLRRHQREDHGAPPAGPGRKRKAYELLDTDIRIQIKNSNGKLSHVKINIFTWTVSDT